MDLAKIKSLIDLVSNSRVTELELSEGGSTLKLSRTAATGGSPSPPVAAVPAAAAPPVAKAPVAAAPAPAKDDVVASPSFGVFHRTPAPEAPPFVTAGSAVEAGQTLCLIEAMKVFTAITAPRATVIEAILIEAGEEVEAGQPLFRLRP